MQGLAVTPEKQQHVKQLVELARGNKATTIAERVEDANTMAVLWQLGVEYIQGYFVHEPEEVVHRLTCRRLHFLRLRFDALDLAPAARQHGAALRPLPAMRPPSPRASRSCAGRQAPPQAPDRAPARDRLQVFLARGDFLRRQPENLVALAARQLRLRQQRRRAADLRSWPPRAGHRRPAPARATRRRRPSGTLSTALQARLRESPSSKARDKGTLPHPTPRPTGPPVRR